MSEAMLRSCVSDRQLVTLIWQRLTVVLIADFNSGSIVLVVVNREA